MFKKILSSLLCLLLVFYNSIAIHTIYAASNITATSLNLNGISGDLQLNPGSQFRVNLAGKNLGTDTLNNVYAKLYFSNNNLFSFLGSSKTLIQLTTTNSDVSTLDYNTSNGLSTLITTPVLPSLAINSQATFAPNPGTANNFLVSTGTTAYQNTINFKLTAIDSLSNSIESNIFTRTIYVNVKPHITDYSFSKSSIVGNGSDTIDLTLRVKDYNGCSNIDGGLVTANLSNIGLSPTEGLIYNSCDADGKTAIFKKTGITTLSSAGDKTFSYSNFSAEDEDNNISNPNDLNTNFDDEDKKTDLVLTVSTSNAPVVTIASINPSSVSNQTSTLNFSATQTGTYKSVINGDGSCSAGTLISDWQDYDLSSLNISIPASNLNDGANTVYVCVKNRVGDIGSANTTLTKDLIQPIISNIVVSPGSVTTANSQVSFTCNENGYYKAIINGNDSGYQSTSANSTNTTTINNAWLNLGANIVNVYCKDIAGNEITSTSSVTKILPTPAMTSSGLTISDNDIGWDGVDGRDVKVMWDTAIATSFAGFESYKIYVLPENTPFSTGYTRLGLVTNSRINTWTGTSNMLNDSAGNPLAGGNYNAYVAIMGTSGELGTEAASSIGTLISDVVPHPSVLSANFTSTSNLRVKFDTNLKTDTASHVATGFTFQVGSTNYTGLSVAGISGDSIDITIPDLLSTSATGILSTSTGAAWGIPVDGSYSNASSGVIISDAASPTISNFTNRTSSYYSNFYSGTIIFNYTSSEQLKAAGYTKIEFSPTGGNADINKTYFITDTSKLVSGNSSVSVNLASLGLVSGAYYDARFITQDLNGNSTISSPIRIKFDNSGPSIVNINSFGIEKVLGILNPTFTWFSTTDNSGNGSGIKGYKLKVYTGNTTYNSWKTCDGSYTEYNITNLADLSRQVTLSNLYNYAWAVFTYDNMENIGVSSTCDNFYINNLVPSFSNTSIINTSLNNSTSYAKSGDALEIKSTITNSNASNIWLDASSLGYSSNISCNSPGAGVSCSYSSNIATYTLNAGASLTSTVKNVVFTAANTSGINTGTTNTNITIDNSNPTAPTISSPTTGIYGGNSLNLIFAGASDNIGINYLKYEYSSDGGSNWNLIGTGVNTSPYTWDITSLTSGVNYKVKISAYDMVGNSSSTISNTFSIDKVAPTVPSNTIVYPSNSGLKVKGGSNINITWNNASISDNIALATNPISLYYSIDGGTNYIQIATNESNDGVYTWAAPSLNNTTMKIKLEASDNVGNKSIDISDNNFEIDSTNPSITVTYAGNGGVTPQTNKYINNSGIDLSASITDTNLSGGNVSYSFYNQTANTYWNGTSFVSGEIFNTMDTIASSPYNLSQTINPSVINGNVYKLKIRASDIVSNIYTTSEISYIGDTISPNLAFVNNSTTYSSGTVLLSGTSSDNSSGLASVKLELKNGTDYFDGTNFQASLTQLATNTSDTYANWNYNFTIPGAIADGTSILVKALSYDKAYKTANIGSGTINVIKDTSGPIMGTGVILFPTATGSFRGGETIDILWDTSKISDVVSGLKANSIKLEYLDGNSVYQTIATGLENTGSYSWTIPSYDKTNTTIRISATDNVSLSTSQVSDTFLVDSLPPEVSQVETMDQDADGQIDGLLVSFSEFIKDDTVNIANFSISDGINITGFSGSNLLDDEKIIINFSNTGTTDFRPSLTYTLGGVKDYVGNDLVAGTMLSIDGVVPRAESAYAYDTDANGKLDKIELNFSENLTNTSVNNGWTLNNAYDGMSIASVSTSGNKINLILNESSSFNTDIGNISISLNNSVYSDLAGNLAGNLNSYTIGDMAPPVYISSDTLDSNSNYKADKINILFSENVASASLAEFGLSYLSTGASISSLTGTGTNTLSINLSETSEDNDTAYKPNIIYSGTSIKDSANNIGVNFTKTVKDSIVPKILTRETYDNNNNGKADAVKIIFSETLNGDVSSTLIGINSYNVSSYLSGSNYVSVNIDEKDLIDTTNALDSKIISNSTLKDTDNNLVPVESNYVGGVEKMGPIISFARFDGVDKIYLDFSENVTKASLANSDFVLNGTTTTSISAVVFTTGTNSAILTISSPDIVYSVSSISFIANTVNDIAGNTQNATVFSRISPSIVINEVMHSDNVVNQYIELKNTSNTTVSMSGWIIQNASSNGTANLVIPAGTTIAANSYYLIANSASASSILSGAITPDFITSSLSINPSSQTNLVLTNNIGTLYDSAIANPWAAGNSSSNYSMERKDVPGNGSVGSNWYTAVASIGFDNTDPRGTPGTENKTDINAPVINSFTPSENTLFPIGDSINLSFDYSDDISGISTGTTNLIIEKYNGTGFDTLSSIINSSNNGTSNSSYTLNHLDFGKYRANFEISDKAGNTINQIINFYVDKVEFIVSTGSIDLGNLRADEAKFAQVEEIVIVKTLGAGFNIYNGKDTMLTKGLTDITDYDGTYGFGFDLYKNENGTITDYDSTIAQVNSTLIGTSAKDVSTSNGTQKTYTYKLKYYVKVEDIQAAGNYSTNANFSLIMNY